MEKDEKEAGTKTLIRNTLIIVLTLMACLIGVSVIMRHSPPSTTVNDVDDKRELRTSTVFGDIKFVSNNDIFSHDAMRMETEKNALVKYLEVSIKEGDTIVHVSNGIGIHLLLMAKLVGQAGRLYAYNPYEKYINTIEKSAEANGFESRIKLGTFAVSDSVFDGLLVYKNNFPVLSGEVQPATYTVPAGYGSMKVSVSTLDELLPQLQNIDYLTIDSSKCEKVLKGAEKLISRSKNAAVVMNFPDENEIAQLEEFSAKFGFKTYLIQEDGTLQLSELGQMPKEKNKYIVLKK